MIKTVFIILIVSYCTYSALIYSYSSKTSETPSLSVTKGLNLWQSKNCQACHQLYGLGGYMGPDLTNIISDSNKGSSYASAFIQSGTARMPKFNLSATEVNELLAFLTWVDQSGQSMVPADKVTPLGNYKLDNQ
jgi:nitric oxide reductase subunit C